MQEEIRKEILTRDVVKKELKVIYSFNLFIQIIFTVAMLGFFALLLYLAFSEILSFKSLNYADIGEKLIKVICVVMSVVFVAFAVYFICSVCKFISNLIAICKNNFEITTDKLVDKKEKRRKGEYSLDELELPEYRIPLLLNNDIICAVYFEKRYVVNKLCFSKYKWFEIPEGKLYRWSEKYKMEHWAVYRWAEIGDEFYVVTIKGKVVYVYNTKHFELQADNK